MVQKLDTSTKNQFKPSYEKVYTSEIVIEIEESFHNNRTMANQKKIVLSDNGNQNIENQLGAMFMEMLRISNTRILARRAVEIEQEKKLQAEALQQLNEMERQKRLHEEQLLKKQQQDFIQNIDHHMQDWNTFKNLSLYVKDMEAYAAELLDPEEKELLRRYIKLVEERIKDVYPINQIFLFMKELGDLMA